jgi:hypothetical protein
LWAADRPSGPLPAEPAKGSPTAFRGRPPEHWRLALRAGCFDTGFGGVGIRLNDGGETIRLWPGDEGPGLVPLLLDWSRDPDPFVRRWGFYFLAQWGDLEVVAPLFRRALADSDAAVRWTAARELRGWHVNGRGTPLPRWAEELVDGGPPDQWNERQARLDKSEVRRLRGWRGVCAVYAGPGVTDAELADLATLPDLEWLYVDGTRVTDRGLPTIARMRGLMVLELTGAEVTPAGVAWLQADRPNLLVKW